MTMLERVARAICRAGMCGPRGHLDEQENKNWRKYLLEARASIEALMEPTEEMRSRAYIVLSEYDASELPNDLNMADAAYRSMLKAALEEK